MIFVPLQNCKPPADTSRKIKLFVLQNEFCGLDTRTCNEHIDNPFLQKVEKFFLHADFAKILCIPTMDVFNKVNNPMVILTISVECATHRHFSQLIYIGWQREFGSCRDVNVAISKIDDFCKCELITV